MKLAAFPTIEGHEFFRGMDLRDYFAAEYGPALVDRAVQALMRTKKSTEVLTEQQIAEQVADWAYQLADAMMERRKR